MFIKKFFYNLSPPSHRDNNARYAVQCGAVCAVRPVSLKIDGEIERKKNNFSYNTSEMEDKITENKVLENTQDEIDSEKYANGLIYRWYCKTPELYNLNKNDYWIDPKNLQNYTLPTFTKKILKFLESRK